MPEETIRTKSGINITALIRASDDKTEITLSADSPRRCVLHWGLAKSDGQWQIPPREDWPEDSSAFGNAAVQTLFDEKKQKQIVLTLKKNAGWAWLNFVLFLPEEGIWDNNQGHNYRIEFSAPAGEAPTPLESFDSLSREIIEKETGRNSWTLMHRFNLCHDLLDRIGRGDTKGLALIYVWLRFSALRQLDWQRNYNTQPRELGHAMDRLTQKLAARYAQAGHGECETIRLIMTTLGRGGNAQRVRDEVLNIMHRHGIKEVAGQFMEQWHQKLHNNTTPDDVIICEAYLDFLRSNGDLGRFYGRLNDSGVTRDRLKNFERPITSDPDFIPQLKDALINDFENFLGVLKEVHSGTDLGVALQGSRHALNQQMSGLMDFIWAHQNDHDTAFLLEKALEVRRWLSGELAGPAFKTRDLLFLDMALEEFVRTVIERSLGQFDPGRLVSFIASALENICLSCVDEEFTLSLKFWRRLQELGRPLERDWSLRAESALERLRRAIASYAAARYELIQSKAVLLGDAFHAAPWTVDLFSEEVLRGRPAFALSALVKTIAPVIRESAQIGDWQIVSHGKGTGQVMSIKALKDIQGKDMPGPKVVIADSVAGDEEIPAKVVAIITPAMVDSLSHLSIRARNTGVLFATCFDDSKLQEIKSLEGRLVLIEPHGPGVIFFQEVDGEQAQAVSQSEDQSPSGAVQMRTLPARRDFTKYAEPMSDFSADNVGYKSINLKRIRDKLPKWINMPVSASIPFGVFEKTLSEEANAKVVDKYAGLLKKLHAGPADTHEILASIRETLLGLKAFGELVKAVERVMAETGLPQPQEWENAWSCIKRVWASKWNDRAYLSRKANGIKGEDLFMSVLVQQAVEAEYAFVLHTVNPVSGARDEIYGEVVTGLGETLAANYPGRALSFVCKKGSGNPATLFYPSKSVGLFGGGLIFRSDSNGEDLAGYAGAGLYDSFMLPAPRRSVLDYSGSSLVWDNNFRTGLLAEIARLGEAVENATGAPQDIEGAFSKGKYYIVQTRPQVGVK